MSVKSLFLLSSLLAERSLSQSGAPDGIESVPVAADAATAEYLLRGSVAAADEVHADPTEQRVQPISRNLREGLSLTLNTAEVKALLQRGVDRLFSDLPALRGLKVENSRFTANLEVSQFDSRSLPTLRNIAASRGFEGDIRIDGDFHFFLQNIVLSGPVYTKNRAEGTTAGPFQCTFTGTIRGLGGRARVNYNNDAKTLIDSQLSFNRGLVDYDASSGECPDFPYSVWYNLDAAPQKSAVDITTVNASPLASSRDHRVNVSDQIVAGDFHLVELIPGDPYLFFDSPPTLQYYGVVKVNDSSSQYKGTYYCQANLKCRIFVERLGGPKCIDFNDVSTVRCQGEKSSAANAFASTQIRPLFDKAFLEASQ